MYKSKKTYFTLIEIFFQNRIYIIFKFQLFQIYEYHLSSYIILNEL